MMPDEAAAISWDTRDLAEGDWFIALPGKRFDGHDFIGDAFSAGALGCIVEERGSYPIASTSFPLIAVEHTYDAFQQLARNWRRRLNPKVIAVTSSPSDPSPVPQLCAKVLSPNFKIQMLPEGTAESLLSAEVQLSEEVQLLIASVAPEDLLQAELLGRALVPTIVILTESGFSHLRAANEELIARAECDLLAHLEKGRGVGIVARRSEDLLHRIRYHFPDRTQLFDGNNVVATTTVDGTTIKLADSEQTFDVTGSYSIADIWSTIFACRHLGLSDSDIAQRLS